MVPVGGLGIHPFSYRADGIVTDNGTIETPLLEHWDGLFALNLGFGKRWRIGPGELRTALAAGVIGYNFEIHNDHFPRARPTASP